MSPPVTSGLVLCLDAALGVTVDGSNKVSYWEDQSGQANHFQQATGANQPELESMPYHDFSYVDFAGSHWMDCVKNDMLNGAAGATCFFVLRVGSIDSGPHRFFLDITQGTSLTSRFRVGIDGMGSTPTEWALKAARVDGDSVTSRLNGMASIDTNYGYVLKISVDCSDKSGNMRQSKWFPDPDISLSNCVLSTGSFSATDSQLITIGRDANGSYPSNDWFTEIIVYDRMVNSSESEQIYKYLHDKYFVRTKTVGSAGDFSTLRDAFIYLDNASDTLTILDSFTINLLEDITDPDGDHYWDLVQSIMAAFIININCNGYTIALPGDGYGIYINTTVWWTNWSFGAYVTQNTSRDSIVKFHDVVFNMIGADPGLALHAQPSADGTDFYNIFIYSLVADNLKAGINPGNVRSSNHYLSIRNVKLYNLQSGFIGNSISTLGSGGTDQQCVENVALFNCGFGTPGTYTGYAIALSSSVVLIYTMFRNVYVLRDSGPSNQDINWNNNYQLFINCATSDASTFADRAVTAPAQVSSCLDGLIALDHLHSVIFGNQHFLKTKRSDGVGLHNGGIIPIYSIRDYDGVVYAAPYPIGPYMPYDFDYRLRVIPDPDRGMKPLKVNFRWEIDEI